MAFSIPYMLESKSLGPLLLMMSSKDDIMMVSSSDELYKTADGEDAWEVAEGNSHAAQNHREHRKQEDRVGPSATLSPDFNHF